MIRTIVIPDDTQNAVRGLNCFSNLAGYDVTVYTDTVRDLDQLVERFQDADALVLTRERTAISRTLIERLPRLKLISQTGRGTAHIDVAACTEHKIAVAVGDGTPYAPAELTWALIMASMRHLPDQVESMRAGKWGTRIGRVVRGRTLGIFGYGKIGSVVAGYGRAFGMRVLVWGREGSLERARKDGFETAASQRDFFEHADIVSLHIKLIKETAGIVTGDDLAAMKPDALIVNTSRAELIAPGALIEALKAGRPGYAALDVYEREPITEPDYPLMNMPNVICTPHLGYVERDTYELYFGQAFDSVTAFAAGEPQGVINPDALRSS